MIQIVAIDQNRGIGKDGQLLHPIRADLKNFKKLTMGKVLIYGSKTLETYPGRKVLPGRLNLILSRHLQPGDVPGARIIPDVEHLQTVLTDLQVEGYTEDDFCVVGGASVYEQLLPYSDKLYLTRIDQNFAADRFYPDFESAGFVAEAVGEWQEEAGVRFRYELWRREDQ